MKPKPPCPVCGDARCVKTLGGGTAPLYRYRCDKVDCDGSGVEWQQIPPHKLTKDDPVAVRIRKRSQHDRSRPYRCNQCGAPDKKGHRCSILEKVDDAVLPIVKPIPSLVDDAPNNNDSFTTKPPLALFVSLQQQPLVSSSSTM